MRGERICWKRVPFDKQLQEEEQLTLSALALVCKADAWWSALPEISRDVLMLLLETRCSALAVPSGKSHCQLLFACWQLPRTASCASPHRPKPIAAGLSSCIAFVDAQRLKADEFWPRIVNCDDDGAVSWSPPAANDSDGQRFVRLLVVRCASAKSAHRRSSTSPSHSLPSLLLRESEDAEQRLTEVSAGLLSFCH